VLSFSAVVSGGCEIDIAFQEGKRFRVWLSRVLRGCRENSGRGDRDIPTFLPFTRYEDDRIVASMGDTGYAYEILVVTS